MCWMSSKLWIGRAFSVRAWTRASHVLSIPRLSSIGETPEAIYFWASLIMERAITVAVVVPSPASKFVWRLACFNISTAAFWNGSSKVTNLATVTPSFVTYGSSPFN